MHLKKNVQPRFVFGFCIRNQQDFSVLKVLLNPPPFSFVHCIWSTIMDLHLENEQLAVMFWELFSMLDYKRFALANREDQ